MTSRTESVVSGVLKRTGSRALRLRVLSGLVTAAVWLIAVYMGKGVFAFLVGGLAVLSVDELTTLLKWRGFPVSRPISMTAAGAMALFAYVAGVNGLMAGVVLLVLFFMVRQALLGLRFADGALNVVVVVYAGVLLSFLILMSGLKSGNTAILIVLLGTWASDIAAYFVGSSFGRTPLAPMISAKKTWEGTIAGLALPALILGIAGMMPVVGLAGDGSFAGAMRGLTLGVAIGVFAPLGDLAESRIKRELNVKDMGAVIPGHGGFLDRLDSLMFTSVAVYYLWQWLT